MYAIQLKSRQDKKAFEKKQFFHPWKSMEYILEVSYNNASNCFQIDFRYNKIYPSINNVQPPGYFDCFLLYQFQQRS